MSEAVPIANAPASPPSTSDAGPATEVAPRPAPIGQASEALDGAALVDAPERFINRELSWLDFNARVLALAENPLVPLLERAKFLAIFSSNLDEFFQVRVAGLKDQVFAGVGSRTPDGRTPSKQLSDIRTG